jgi:hypothetical protein
MRLSRVCCMAAIVVISCAVSSGVSYDRAITTHGLSFVVPVDSSDIVWQRGRSWLIEQYERRVLGTPYTSEIWLKANVVTTTLDKAYIKMIRRPQGDSVYCMVEYNVERDPLNKRNKYVGGDDSISELDVVRLAHQLSYIAHTGVDREEFNRRAATGSK